MSCRSRASRSPNWRRANCSPCVYVSGLVAIGFIFAGAIRRRVFSFLEVYLACYVGILLVWPFTDPRFFAPVIPLLLAYGWIGLRSLSGRPAVKRVAVCYCVVFCLLGGVAMGHSLYESNSGRTPTHLIDQQWRKHHVDWFAAYRHFGGACDPPPQNDPGQSTRVPLNKSNRRSG